MLPKHFPFKQRLHAAKTFPPQRKATRCQNISPLNKGCTLPKHFPLKERLHVAKTFPPQRKATPSRNISPSNKGYTCSKHFPLERSLKHFPARERLHVLETFPPLSQIFHQSQKEWAMKRCPLLRGITMTKIHQPSKTGTSPEVINSRIGAMTAKKGLTLPTLPR